MSETEERLQPKRKEKGMSGPPVHTASVSKVSNKSVRVYIPVQIVEKMDIQDGDSLAFVVVEEEGELVGKFKKVSWQNKRTKA